MCYISVIDLCYISVLDLCYILKCFRFVLYKCFRFVLYKLFRFNSGSRSVFLSYFAKSFEFLKRYFLHFEGRFSLSQYLIIQFNQQILGFNNYKYSIYCKIYAIAILRDGPQYRKSIAQGNANYSKARLNTWVF